MHTVICFSSEFINIQSGQDYLRYVLKNIHATSCQDISVDESFLALVDEIRKTKDLTVTHGKLRGHEMKIHDTDECSLLKENSWSVLEELSHVLGVNIEKMFIGKNRYFFV